MGSSIPTNTKRSQAAAHGQKKATVRRRENGSALDAAAVRHKSAALNKTDLGTAG